MLIGRDDLEFKEGSILRMSDIAYLYKGKNEDKKEVYIELINNDDNKNVKTISFDDMSEMEIEGVSITKKLIEFLDSSEQILELNTRSDFKNTVAIKIKKDNKTYIFAGDVDSRTERSLYDKAMNVPNEMGFVGLYSEKLKTFYYDNMRSFRMITTSGYELKEALKTMNRINDFKVKGFSDINRDMVVCLEDLLKEKLKRKTIKDLMGELSLEKEIDIDSTETEDIRKAVEFNYIQYGVMPKDLNLRDISSSVFIYSDRMGYEVNPVEIISEYIENQREFSEKMLKSNLEFFAEGFFPTLNNFFKAKEIWDSFSEEELNKLEEARTIRKVLGDTSKKTVRVKIKGLENEIRLKTSEEDTSSIDYDKKYYLDDAFNYGVSYYDLDNSDSDYLKKEYPNYKDSSNSINLKDIESISYRKNKIYDRNR